MLRLLVAALCLRGALPAGPSLLEAHEHNAPIVYSLDASPGLVDHAFSAVASLSSVVHASANATALRFAFVLTIPEASLDEFTAALCATIISAVGRDLHRPGLPVCARRSLAAFLASGSDGSCAAAGNAALPARVTFVHFPQHAGDYPGRVQRVLELLCCSQHRYAVDRPELARSMGNHARFFAYLALLPLGVRRAMFLDVDTLAHDDVAPLMASPLDEQKFVAAAKRCAPKRAAYKPRFKFSDPLVAEFGLRLASTSAAASVAGAAGGTASVAAGYGFNGPNGANASAAGHASIAAGYGFGGANGANASAAGHATVAAGYGFGGANQMSASVAGAIGGPASIAAGYGFNGPNGANASAAASLGGHASVAAGYGFGGANQMNASVAGAAGGAAAVAAGYGFGGANQMNASAAGRASVAAGYGFNGPNGADPAAAARAMRGKPRKFVKCGHCGHKKHQKTSTCRYRHVTCKKANKLIARERAERAANRNDTDDDDDDDDLVVAPPPESDAAGRSGGPRPPPPPPPPPGAASASGKLGGAGNLAGWLIRSH
ncbi:expressed protein [Aureococcus anophagefferens]|uniref:Expressed protein n=1 Tax=Aureococcus anophagefferens TaxID=44056 RepID=F0Y2X8_AURAN|nr:expressed protein [Aureococcus anophagefferens]EGB10344.1 expressed protein [Aureococcus anophagefferens]|eukprot:XP_009035149.1 expressed protein [Aureococcus anophagefferens]